MEKNIIEYRGFDIRIEYDEDPRNPREDFDPMGKMVCFHSRYDLGDKHNFSSSEDLIEFLEENNATWLPLFLYDHSGITMSTSAFSCPWDSGQVGVIYTLPEDIEREYGKLEDARSKAIEHMRYEVEEYDQYLTGEVFGYIIEPKDNQKEIDCYDSCWGFFGFNAIDYMVVEAKSHIDFAINEYKESVIKYKAERKQTAKFYRECWAD